MEGYQKYLRAIKNKNPMSLAQWKEGQGINDEEEQHEPITIRPKNQRKVSATHSNYEKVEG